MCQSTSVTLHGILDKNWLASHIKVISMASNSLATIAAAAIGAFALIAVALINRSPDSSPSITDTSPSVSVVTCDPLPAVEKITPKAKEGYVWVPADFRLTFGKLEATAGHWEHVRAGGRNKYIPGHWEKDAGHCIWVPGNFVADN
jgi:streptogramin lyase